MLIGLQIKGKDTGEELDVHGDTTFKDFPDCGRVYYYVGKSFPKEIAVKQFKIGQGTEQHLSEVDSLTYDAHKMRAVEFYGVTVDKVTLEMRRIGKKLNFAEAYGVNSSVFGGNFNTIDKT